MTHKCQLPPDITQCAQLRSADLREAAMNCRLQLLSRFTGRQHNSPALLIMLILHARAAVSAQEGLVILDEASYCGTMWLVRCFHAPVFAHLGGVVQKQVHGNIAPATSFCSMKLQEDYHIRPPPKVHLSVSIPYKKG